MFAFDIFGSQLFGMLYRRSSLWIEIAPSVWTQVFGYLSPCRTLVCWRKGGCPVVFLILKGETLAEEEMRTRFEGRARLIDRFKLQVAEVWLRFAYS
jgi:hypothetical protein